MPYAEAVYFDGFHFAHIAAYDEFRRLRHIAQQWARAERETCGRIGKQRWAVG